MTEDIDWRKYASRFKTYPKRIDDKIDPNAGMIVCIPVCGEPDLLSTLESLNMCDLPKVPVEVILLFNVNTSMSDHEKRLHHTSWNECIAWVEQHQSEGVKYFPVFIDELPDPRGGVGWARKLAMDEAARRLDQEGIIVCLDADCIVNTNYLNTIYHYFTEKRNCEAASIYIEHSIEKLSPIQRDAIVRYELHLRYLVNVMRWCGHPFAYHTIGSAMAIKRRAYLEQGGINTRRAGEDFYFLQKFIELGTYCEINSTTVFPSPRISNRVPFGTGRAMQQILENQEDWVTTDFRIFRMIRSLFNSINQLRTLILTNLNEDYVQLQNELELSNELVGFLRDIDFLEHCQVIVSHTSTEVAFRKRFFRYFNAFRMIKYMHFMRDRFFPDVPVITGVSDFIEEIRSIKPENEDELSYLILFRKFDRTQQMIKLFSSDVNKK